VRWIKLFYFCVYEIQRICGGYAAQDAWSKNALKTIPFVGVSKPTPSAVPKSGKQ
jgi:hypothetical protein